MKVRAKDFKPQSLDQIYEEHERKIQQLCDSRTPKFNLQSFVKASQRISHIELQKIFTEQDYKPVIQLFIINQSGDPSHNQFVKEMIKYNEPE